MKFPKLRFRKKIEHERVDALERFINKHCTKIDKRDYPNGTRRTE